MVDTDEQDELMKRRSQMTDEKRQVAALESIADALLRIQRLLAGIKSEIHSVGQKIR